MFCKECGTEINDKAEICPKCGCRVRSMLSSTISTVSDPNASTKNRLAAGLLCFFLGGLGLHRFYVGKIGTGILYLLTGAIFGIGWLVDLIMIVCGRFKDADGKYVTNF